MNEQASASYTNGHNGRVTLTFRSQALIVLVCGLIGAGPYIAPYINPPPPAVVIDEEVQSAINAVTQQRLNRMDKDFDEMKRIMAENSKALAENSAELRQITQILTNSRRGEQ